MLGKLFEYAGWRVLAEALEEDSPFYVKEFAKRSSMSYFAANSFLRYFSDEGILTKETRGNLHLYRVNRELPLVRYLRITFNLMRLEGAKLVQQLSMADAGLISVVLYGSWSRGENRKGSDVDIVVLSLAPKGAFTKKLAALERSLGLAVELQVFTPQTWKAVKKEDHPFYEDVVTHGILLYGSPVRI